jgi:hypothetical protein
VTTITKSSYPPFVTLDDIATNMRRLTTLKWIIACQKGFVNGIKTYKLTESVTDNDVKLENVGHD